MNMQEIKAINFKNRRKLLKSLAVIMSFPLYHKLTFAATFSVSISFEVFVEYIEKIFNIDHLNADMSKRIYHLTQDEPWGMNHLQRVVEKSREVSDTPVLTRLDEGEHWFLGHLLTTWMTGIYYHESSNVVVSYEHALMHEALASIRPIPGLSTEKFGFWHQPPKSVQPSI